MEIKHFPGIMFIRLIKDIISLCEPHAAPTTIFQTQSLRPRQRNQRVGGRAEESAVFHIAGSDRPRMESIPAPGCYLPRAPRRAGFKQLE